MCEGFIKLIVCVCEGERDRGFNGRQISKYAYHLSFPLQASALRVQITKKTPLLCEM